MYFKSKEKLFYLNDEVYGEKCESRVLECKNIVLKFWVDSFYLS